VKKQKYKKTATEERWARHRGNQPFRYCMHNLIIKINQEHSLEVKLLYKISPLLIQNFKDEHLHFCPIQEGFSIIYQTLSVCGVLFRVKQLPIVSNQIEKQKQKQVLDFVSKETKNIVVCTLKLK